MQNFTVPSVFTAIDQFTKPMRRMQMAAKGFSNAAVAGVDRINLKFNKLLPSISQAGKQLISFASTAAVAGAVVAGAVFSTDAIRNYEVSMKSLKAITRVSDAQFQSYKKTIHHVAQTHRTASNQVAKTFEVVGSKMPELLKNEKALSKIANAAILLKKASGDNMEIATNSLTGTLNQFNLKAEDSIRVIDAMAAGQVAGQVSVSQLSEGINRFGAILYGINGTVEDAVTLQETLGKTELYGAEAGTNLRNILLKLATVKSLPKTAIESMRRYGVDMDKVQNNSISLSERLKEMAKIAGSTTAIEHVFGESNTIAAAGLLRKMELFDELLSKVSGREAAGSAAELAAEKTDTFNDKLTELSNTWVNIITSSEKAGDSLNFAKRAVVFLTDNLGALVKWASYGIAAFIGLKAMMFIVKAGMVTYNTILGISTALSKGHAFALRGNAIALKAYGAVTKTATAIQWSLNTAFYGIPIFWIIAGILLLVGAVTLIIKKWDSWGAALSLFLGPLGLVISLIQSFRKNWDMVVKSFETDGMIGGLKAIGKVLLDAILVPFQQFLSLLSKIPGIDFGDNLAKAIGNYRTEVLGTTDAGRGRAAFEEYYAVNPEKSRQESLSRTIEEKRSTVDVNFGNIPAGTTIAGDGLAEMFPKLTPSFSLP